MKITELSIHKPVTISMFFLAIVAVSLVAFVKIPIDMIPDISFPVLTVIVNNQGMGPEEVERKITQFVEESVGTVNNIKRIKSNSVEGISVVSIEFVWGSNMAEAASDVREKLDLTAKNLPDTSEKPITFKFDVSMIPVYMFVISGLTNDKNKDFADNVIKTELEQLDGVSMVRIDGGLLRQVLINIDRNRLKAYNLSFDDVVKIVKAENINQPAGNIKIGFEDFTIRTEGEYKRLDEVRKVVVGVQGKITKKPIYLEDIAEITLGYEDKNDIRILDQNEALLAVCYKRSGENTVKVADRIIKKLEILKKRFPRGLYIKEIMNSADIIKKSITNIGESAWEAGILSILVVIFFLRSIRTTFIIGLTIPISVIGTFLLMYLNKITLNLISFGGLALGVGMLVDNSIVVLENIFRHRQLGEDKINAAIVGAKEVAMPITASTLTIICVFLPLILFVEGVAGAFFKEMALTVSFSLLASLFVALTLVPMLSSRMINITSLENRQFKSKIMTRMYKMGDVVFHAIDAFYLKFITWALKHRLTIVFIVLGAFIFSLFLFQFVQKGFIPESDDNRIYMTIELKEGTRLEVTEALAFNISERLSKLEGVEAFTAEMGTSQNFFAVAMGMVGSHLISARITLVDREKRQYGVAEIRNIIRKKLEDIPGIKLTFILGSFLQSQDSPVEIQVRGKELDNIFVTAKKIEALINSKFKDELKDVYISRKDGSDELVIHINRVKAATLGLNVSAIANTVKNNFIGITATRYRYQGDEIDMVVRLTEQHRTTIEDLKNVIIKSPLGFSVPISQVIELTEAKAPVKIERINQERVVYIKANNAPGVGLANVVDKLSDTVAQEIVKPDDVNIIYGGSYQDMQESFQDLALAFLLAVMLIYMVMASQFESFLNPFLILTAIPLSFIGAFVLLFFTGTEFNVNAGIGMMILAGIVVNQGIVLIEYIRQLREEHGYELFEAIIIGGRIRLRPIVMTKLTTILGMVPLAIGIGSGTEMNAPMAISIIGGLTLAFFLTLVFLPVLYSYVQGSIIKRRKRILLGLDKEGA